MPGSARRAAAAGAVAGLGAARVARGRGWQPRRHARAAGVLGALLLRYRWRLSALRRQHGTADLRLVPSVAGIEGRGSRLTPRAVLRQWTEPGRHGAALAALHAAGAAELAELCKRQGGAYVKAGQLLSVRRDLPAAYRTHLAELQDRAPARPWRGEIERRVERELGGRWFRYLRAVRADPVATASLAQVHAAETHSGRRVALKVKLPGVDRQIAGDLGLLKAMASMAEALFPALQVRWLVEEVQRGLERELNFSEEALNMVKCAEMFREDNAGVRVPQVLGELCTDHLIAMEFVDGVKPTDASGLEALNVDRCDVADRLAEAHATMLFTHGLVHADAHPGNFLVQAGSRKFSWIPERVHERLGKRLRPASRRAPRLVLLDHGLYLRLSDARRRALCKLWVSLAKRDPDGLREACRRLGAPEGLAGFHPLLFEGDAYAQARAWQAIPSRERAKLEEHIAACKERGEVAAEALAFARSLGPDMVLLQRAATLLACTSELICGGDGAQPAKRRLAIFARLAAEGANR